MMRGTAKLLLDARNASEEIESFTDGKTNDDIWDDRTLQLILHRLLEIVGHALYKASRADSATVSHIPDLQGFTDMRPQDEADDASVDYENIWRIATQRIPDLRLKLDELLEQAPDPVDNAQLARTKPTIDNVIPLVSDSKHAIANLCRKFRIKKLDVFGSAVTGSFDPDASDLDFIVDLGEYEAAVGLRYLSFCNALEDLLGYSVEVITEPSIRNPYFREAVEEQRVNIYDGLTDQAAA